MTLFRSFHIGAILIGFPLQKEIALFSASLCLSLFQKQSVHLASYLEVMIIFSIINRSEHKLFSFEEPRVP